VKFTGKFTILGTASLYMQAVENIWFLFWDPHRVNLSNQCKNKQHSDCIPCLRSLESSVFLYREGKWEHMSVYAVCVWQ